VAVISPTFSQQSKFRLRVNPCIQSQNLLPKRYPISTKQILKSILLYSADKLLGFHTSSKPLFKVVCRNLQIHKGKIRRSLRNKNGSIQASSIFHHNYAATANKINMHTRNTTPRIVPRISIFRWDWYFECQRGHPFEDPTLLLLMRLTFMKNV